jgi:hypothetical protein
MHYVPFNKPITLTGLLEVTEAELPSLNERYKDTILPLKVNGRSIGIIENITVDKEGTIHGTITKLLDRYVEIYSEGLNV